VNQVAPFRTTCDTVEGVTEHQRRAGTVRFDIDVRKAIDQYAADRGITYNAAVNILIRIGLKAERKPAPDRKGRP
jgi:hypothetical protein